MILAPREQQQAAIGLEGDPAHGFGVFVADLAGVGGRIVPEQPPAGDVEPVEPLLLRMPERPLTRRAGVVGDPFDLYVVS